LQGRTRLAQVRELFAWGDGCGCWLRKIKLETT